MKILFLAPQPFFSERGTPIAVDLMLRTLSRRGERVDVVTYHLGKDVFYKGVRIYRTPKVPFIRYIRPGFSMRKMVCDVLMTLKVIPMAARGRYDVVHAVEEAVFIAMLLKFLFGIPYIYDMDSSLSQQMIDRYPRLFKPVFKLLSQLEKLAIRNAKAVVPVCDVLSQGIEKYNPGKVTVLRDISLLSKNGNDAPVNLRTTLDLNGAILMYVGSLEPYQGIDLLLQSFGLSLQQKRQVSLVIIGGKEADILYYQGKARQLGIDHQVFFLGHQPVAHLADYLAQADILVSPRIQGSNTPMKIFSYLDSGKALLATNLPTHTQVLNNEVALLAEPSPAMFADGVMRLLDDKKLRRKLGAAGKQLVKNKHSQKVFDASLNALYDWLTVELGGNPAGGAGQIKPDVRSSFSASWLFASRRRVKPAARSREVQPDGQDGAAKVQGS